MQHTVNAVIRPGEQSGYVAECVELSVVTQGSTLDRTVANLQEAVSLHLDGEDLADFGLVSPVSIVATLEIAPAVGAA